MHIDIDFEIIIIFKEPGVTMSYGNIKPVFGVMSQISEVESIVYF